MMQFEQQRSATVTQLSRLAQSDALSGKSRQTCDEISSRLETPVTLGFFGPPGSGKRALVNAFLGAEVLPLTGAGATVEITAGPEATCTVRQDDDTVAEIKGYPTAEFLNQDAAFASITSPHCTDMHCAIFLFECDEDPGAMEAAIEWAATRVDIAIWCSAHWSEGEQASWATASDRLRSHAILSLRDKGALSHAAVTDAGFGDVFHTEDTPAAQATMAGRIRSTLDEAMEQELATAELFLRRYGPAEPAPSVVEKAEEAEALTHLPLLGKLFLQVRQAALTLLSSLSDGPIEVADFMGQIESALEEIADLMVTSPDLGATWPALERTIFEARDLAVLLRYEGRGEQASQGARLISQIRDEVERAYLEAQPARGRLQ